ncbi:unnamed protein product [Closterium sp. NIES-64]|nr:unnamed protein product [Closterium sp. NIES-64]
MSSTLCFVIVGRNDCPLYDAELGTAPRRDEAAHLHQFILHGAMDIVQDAVWATNNMHLKAVDKFTICSSQLYSKPRRFPPSPFRHIPLCVVPRTARHLKAVDKFNDLLVSVYTKLLLLHDSRNEDGIKNFFQEVHELYIKVLMNPLHVPGSKIISTVFDARVRALAKRHL